MAEEVLPRFVWMTGELRPWEQATVHASLLGHATVAGVFEGIRAYHDPDRRELYVFRLREHMQRLFDSMKVVRMNPPCGVDDLVHGLVDLVRANEYHDDTNVLALAYFDGLTWSFAQPGLDRPTAILMRCREITSKLLSGKGSKCCVSSWVRIDDADMPPRVKCVSNYHNARLAFTEAQLDGYDQALLLNRQGKVAEAPAACLFTVRRGVVSTPPVTASVLESITRATLIQLFDEVLGVHVQEREIDRTELYLADEVFLCGTAAEVTPVVSVDRYQIGNGQEGELTGQIGRVYHDVLRGVDPRYAGWRTPVWQD